jgi:hypothetical protein
MCPPLIRGCGVAALVLLLGLSSTALWADEAQAIQGQSSVTDSALAAQPLQSTDETETPD